MQPQLVCLQYVETRKWDTIELLTLELLNFPWICVYPSAVNKDTDAKSSCSFIPFQRLSGSHKRLMT